MEMVEGAIHSGETKNMGMRTLEVGERYLLEKRLHLIEKAVAIGFHGHAALFGVFHQKFFLPGGQFCGNLDLDRIDLVAGSASLQAGNPQSFDTEDLVMLSTSRDFDDGISFEGRDFNLSSEHGRDEIDRHITRDIETFSLKDLMRLDGDGYIEIAGRSIIRTMLAFIGETKSHAGFNAGRNMHGDRAFFVDPLAALTCRAGFRDDATSPFALSAWPADTKKSLLKPNLPGAFAASAGFNRR